MIIQLVPADGRRSVQLPAITNAWTGLQNYLNLLQDMKLTVGDDLDQGWSEAKCPSCENNIDPYWFAEVIEAQAALSRVSNMITMPCCNSNLGIAALNRQQKQGLDGFVLSFRSLGRDMDTKVIRKLEQVLNCRLNIFYDIENQD